ncbi:hypothetical protein [Spirosoma sp. KNUC1025]|uniref:hypothetical protein n=1 Tax=Spirosoma sp. KNUC1025 TaxID=2894082 RepID=UPI00386C9DCC|nr:hypothetical protein LN737_07285 [Spirosoma sp. KNUC1025]
MKESSFITILAGVFMVLMAIYVFILLDYQPYYVLILVGLIGLVYLMTNSNSTQ